MWLSFLRLKARQMDGRSAMWTAASYMGWPHENTNGTLVGIGVTIEHASPSVSSAVRRTPYRLDLRTPRCRYAHQHIACYFS